MKHNSPRILVISHTCFRESDSNGRTLGNLLSGCHYEKLAQFYLQNAYPDFTYCEDHFRVTDSDVMHSIFQTSCGSCIRKKKELSVEQQAGKRAKKSVFKMVLRNIAWSSWIWWKPNFTKWLEELKPEIIIVQTGDGSFLFKLALKIAKKYQSKIIVFNTEGYYFKDYDFVAKKRAGLLYKLYISEFRKQYKRLVTKAEMTIYNNSKLKHDYDQIIDHKNTVIYCPASDAVVNCGGALLQDQLVYMGNLGVGRFETLMKVAIALKQIDITKKLCIYGKCDAIQLEEIKKHRNVQYMGFVSYGEVLEITKASEYVIHVESFDNYYVEDSKYAFSTKIADCLAYSNNFIVIAPETVASSEYLSENKCALLITQEDNIQRSLKTIMNDPNLRRDVRAQGHSIAQKNHSKAQCTSAMDLIIRKVIG